MMELENVKIFIQPVAVLGSLDSENSSFPPFWRANFYLSTNWLGGGEELELGQRQI